MIQEAVVHNSVGVLVVAELRHLAFEIVADQREQGPRVFWSEPDASRACPHPKSVDPSFAGAMDGKTGLDAVVHPSKEHGVGHRLVPLDRAVPFKEALG